MKKIVYLALLSLLITGCSSSPSENGNEGGNEGNVPEETYYKIDWKNIDGSLLYEGSVKEGETPVYPNPDPKYEDNNYTYTFTGWNPEIVPAVKDATYTAKYSKVEKLYTVTWSIEGVTTTEQYKYGEYPTYKGDTPTKEEDQFFTYYFIGWTINGSGTVYTTNFPKVTGNVTYVAIFGSEYQKYTVTWDIEGVLTTETYSCGDVPSYKGSTPTKASTAEFEYTFRGWATGGGYVYTDTLPQVFKNTTYYAFFNSQKKYYQIAVVLHDNSTKILNLPYGSTGYRNPTTMREFIEDETVYVCTGFDYSDIVSSNITIHATYETMDLTSYNSLEYNSLENTNGYLKVKDDKKGYLTKLVVPLYFGGNFVNRVNEMSFVNCANLKEVYVSDGHHTIDQYAFQSCEKLETVRIPNSLDTLGKNAFSGCGSLKCNKYEKGYYLGNEDNPYLIYFKSDSSIVTSSFHENTKLIADAAFDHCKNLTTLNYPRKFRMVTDNLCTFCSNLTNVNLEEGIYRIDSFGFGYCTSLTSISLPASLQTINISAFYGCSSLTEYNYAGTKEKWNLLDIDDQWRGVSAPDAVVHCTNGDIPL